MPVAANSAAYINSIGASHPVKAEFGTRYGFSIHTVSGNVPAVNVSFEWSTESNPGPYPIPANIWIEPSADRHAFIVDTTNCTLYEFFALSKQAGVWKAAAGAIYPLSSNALRPNNWTSADAAGLPMMPAFYRYEEVAAGHINHAVRITAPHSRNSHIWPARHTASSLTGSQYPQFGQRFRLKADFDISSFSPQAKVILQAMKTYGLIFATMACPGI